MMTIKDACSTPANFMYIWADEKRFLQYIPKKYADVIRVKKGNQLKVLYLMANEDEATVKNYTAQIRQAFIDTYDMTPFDALVILAQGGSVAGKNWAEGVFGVGAARVVTFVGHENVTVRPEDGHILNNGEDVTSEALTVYQTVNKKPIAFQLGANIDGIKYMSQYYKRDKKYYAYSFSNADGEFSARTGTEITASEGSDIWGSILGMLEKFMNWLIKSFGGSDRELLNSSNTVPNQHQDGFTTDDPSEAGLILVALAAGGLLLGSGMKKSKKA